MEKRQDQFVCPFCGGTEMKQGKLHGVASLQPLAARSGIGGSELVATFCADCGEVLRLRVKDPQAIKE